ncbi:hypothetical protein [Falsihalocynthiibacter arcticus]|uniref:Uncharacterized protein n=1 Tax=Falsihalocynthiibacter arcticus TaxID=1579316 RepID=A0A126V185_9RHOB|nr:hypothetical protein [Falsihalocynthiibacter arcticus]AML51705.1 hypothetical protein RC74_10925 [Falsihalocynthiibacter arcticus]
MIDFTRISLTLAFAAMSPQLALANIVCAGTYEFFSGKNTVQAIPGEAPENGARAAELYNSRAGWVGQLIPKPQSEGLHEVEVSQCGRQFVLTQGSKTMLFLQSIMDETLYVAQDIGTAEVDLTLRVVDHKIMVGTIAGKSHGFEINYPVAMDPRDVSMPAMRGCAEATVQEEQVDEDRLIIDPALRLEAINIVADQLGVPRDRAETYIYAQRTVAKTESRNDEPIILSPGEGDCPLVFAGIRDCVRYPSDTTTIVETNVLLDEGGRLLPVTTDGSATNRIRVDDPGLADICAPEESLPPASQRLRMTFFAIDEDGINDVQASLVDADTDIATDAHYANGYNAGRQQRVQGADEAYQGVGAPVTGMH